MRKAKTSLFVAAVFVVLAAAGLAVRTAEGATYGGGSGTEADPYVIYTAEQLNAIGANPGDWSKDFKLMADIDLSAYTGTSFNIIGRSTVFPHYFSGTFNGNGRVISNFNYSSTGINDIGLFGQVRLPFSEIRDLYLVNPRVDAGTGWQVGSLIGRLKDGSVIGCHAQGGDIVGSFEVGGLVGECYYGRISSCSFSGDVATNTYGKAGGLVGYNGGGDVNDCSSAGSVSAYSLPGGGLAGQSDGTITRCSSSASVSGVSHVGGLVGSNVGSRPGRISACFCSGDVFGLGSADYPGGLAGFNNGLIEDCYSTSSVFRDYKVGGLVGSNYGEISNCYSAGTVSETGVHVGGLVGRNGGSVINSFWDIESSGAGKMCGYEDVGTGCDNSFGKTTAEMQTESTFTSAGWDFTTPIWVSCDVPGYPRLWWEPCAQPPMLVSLKIVGPDEVAENFRATYKAMAYYDNNSVKDVTDLAEWSVFPDTSFAEIDGGLLTTSEVGTDREEIAVVAEYGEGRIMMHVGKRVTVFAVCPSGSALRFDGENDYVEVADDESQQITNNQITVSGWIKLGDDVVNAQRRVVCKQQIAHIAWGLEIFGDGYGGSTGNQLVFHDSDGGTSWHNCMSGTDLNLNQWYHVAVTDNGGAIRIYLDGQLDTSSDDGYGIPSNIDAPIFIGRTSPPYTSFFDGTIDEVRIYDRALSAGEIWAGMHVKTSAGEPNLVGYWDFDEGQGQVAYDVSGNGNNGRLGSTPYADDSDPAWVASDAPVGVCGIPVSVDIKPGSCPNPVNVASRGVVPVAILGLEDFEASSIDAASVELSGVGAIRSSLEDVATPVADGNECGCSEAGPDGYTDLTLKFNTREIVQALGEVSDGDVLSLTLTGVLQDGTLIEGTDCIVIHGKFKPFNKGDLNKDGVVNVFDFATMAENWLESTVVAD